MAACSEGVDVAVTGADFVASGEEGCIGVDGCMFKIGGGETTLSLVNSLPVSLDAGGGDVVNVGENILGAGCNGGGDRIRGGGEKTRWGDGRTGDGDIGRCDIASEKDQSDIRCC